MRIRAVVAGGLCGAALAGGAGYALVRAGEASPAAETTVRASIDGWRWAPREPAATGARDGAAANDAATGGGRRVPGGTGAASGAERAERHGEADRPAGGARDRERSDPAPSRPASRTSRPSVGGPAPAALGDPDDADAALVTAEVLDNGVALPPLEAPAAVRAIFEAGNTIARAPYKWGGGHGRWKDDGYDCSGSVSYALAAAGLLDGPRTSGQLMRYGKPGKGRWITIYANEGHVWMVVAGVRFDTVARGRTGSRWIDSMADTSGYVARHPEGL